LLERLHLHLPRSEISDEGLLKLGESFQKFGDLKEISLSFTDSSDVTKAGLESFQRKIQKRFPQARFSTHLGLFLGKKIY